MCRYVACVPECGGPVCCASQTHDNPAHRPRNHTLCDTPSIKFVFQVTQADPGSSLMMTDYCRNM
jgi:hypothetical protein